MPASQIDRAYRAMAERAQYRPAAPSDGFGNITGPLNIAREVAEYKRDWVKQEADMAYPIGCPDYQDRVAFIYAVELARAIAGGRAGLAVKLANMVVEELVIGTGFNECPCGRALDSARVVYQFDSHTQARACEQCLPFTEERHGDLFPDCPHSWHDGLDHLSAVILNDRRT